MKNKQQRADEGMIYMMNRQQRADEGMTCMINRQQRVDEGMTYMIDILVHDRQTAESRYRDDIHDRYTGTVPMQ